MNTLKQRIAGLVAAGLVTVGGVAMIAQPAWATNKNPTVDQAASKCVAKGGVAIYEDEEDVGPGGMGQYQCFKANGKTENCIYVIPKTGGPSRIASATCITTKKNKRPSAGSGVVTTPGGAKPAPTIPNAGTGVVTTPGGTATPPTTVPPHAGTGIVVKPGGAMG